MTKSKTAIAIALFLMFSMTAMLVVDPFASAHAPPWSIKTWTFISCSPNPVGIGQNILVNFWLDPMPPTALGQGGDRWTLYCDVTTPQGVTTRMGPFTSDLIGASWTDYLPTTVGDYTFQAFFLGQTLEGKNPPLWAQGEQYVGDYFEPSSSPKVVVTVQQEPLAPYPQAPLPTEYWERPIMANNRDWSVLGGNWLLGAYDATGNRYNPYTKAPNTAHVLWSKQFASGGQLGGMFGGTSSTMYAIDMYQTAFQPAIVLNGVVYYNRFVSGQGMWGFVAVDLRTGKELFMQEGNPEPVTQAMSLDQPGRVLNNNTFNRITLGQIYNYLSPNQYGGHSYLWAIGGGYGTTRYDMYDAFTGELQLSLRNCSSGTFSFSSDGSLLCYMLGTSWIAMWNSSRVEGMLGGTYGSPKWQLRPRSGQELDWRTGIEWNVTKKPYTEPFNQGIKKIADGVIVTNTVSTYGAVPQNWLWEVAYDADTGQELWAFNRTLGIGVMPGAGWDYNQPTGEGVIMHMDKQALTWSAYDLHSGQKLWGPTEPTTDDPFGQYGGYNTIANGRFYATSFGGYVRCYNLTTGALLWTYSSGKSGLEWQPSENWPFNVWSGRGIGCGIADGKLYVSTGHVYNPPMFNGAQMHCIDAETGELIYTAPGWWEETVIADGQLLSFNGYDQKIYAFGKGLTATTVTASPKISIHGSSVLVEGTVTDQSPGQTCLGIPTAGTPAVSDESMSQWMSYLYWQQPKPANATGVEVIIEVLDPNNNYYEVGRTTSDASGLFKLAFVPEVPGEYTIIARFPGSDSYYSSYKETAMNVEEGAAATPEPTQAPASLADQYLLPGIGGIIAAIAIVGAIIVLMLRKK